jgi:indole-3-acetate monooxygenase
MTNQTETIWNETRSLAPIVREARAEADALRRLPDSIVEAFAERDIYRLMLPVDLGGRGIDPLLQFDLSEEVSSYDGSVGWNYAIGSGNGSLGGRLARNVAGRVFAGPDQTVAASGAPTGRAVPVEGGYHVTGRFAWASGIHQADWVIAGCFVYEGDARKLGPAGHPMVIHALVPKREVTVLDTWQTGGMRGTGSTEFEMRDLFVPAEHGLILFGGAPLHPDPLYRLPTSFFGFALTAVPLGIARGAVAALKDLAARKKPVPPRPGLADKPATQYAVGKAEAMVEAARAGAREAFSLLWAEVRETGEASMASRARLRRACVHAVETSRDAVELCYRAAGGSALFENEPFERALRDVHATAGHLVFQQEMMEDAGRVALGLPPLLGIF